MIKRLMLAAVFLGCSTMVDCAHDLHGTYAGGDVTAYTVVRLNHATGEIQSWSVPLGGQELLTRSATFSISGDITKGITTQLRSGPQNCGKLRVRWIPPRLVLALGERVYSLAQTSNPDPAPEIAFLKSSAAADRMAFPKEAPRPYSRCPFSTPEGSELHLAPRL